MATTINADDGVISGSAGLKTEADASGELALQTNGTTAVTITTGALVLRGYTSKIDADDAGGSNRTTWGYQTHSTAVSGAGYLATYWADNEFGPGGLTVGKSRGASIGTRAIVQNGDELGQIGFVGDDGTNFISAAGIFAVVDGTPGTNDMPGRLVFSTTADGASTPTERMRIDSSGNVGIGTSSPLTKLNVNGTDGELIRISVTPDAAVQQEPALGFATGVTNTHPAAKISALEFDASDSRASLLFYTRDTNSDVAPTERMRISSAGLTTLASGSGLSISATGVTSPAAGDGNVFSGTYTPTLTNVTNISASTPQALQYMRVGNVVTVSGQVLIDPTTTGLITLRMTLPIASNFSATGNGNGVFASVENETGVIYADATNDAMIFQSTIVSDVTNTTYRFSFTYRII